jgi:glutamate racemase
VLGCTHYPHIQKKVEELSDGRFEVINSPEIVAARVLKDLAARDLKNDSSHQGKLEFYVSDYTAVFENIAQIMFGSNITLVEENIWE